MPDAQIAIAAGGGRGIGRNAVLCLVRRGVRSVFTDNAIRQKATPGAMAADFCGSMRM